MEIVVKGRHTEVPAGFRQHAQTKLARLERLDAKCYRLDVECSREHNPRLSEHSERIELTVYSRGPVIRAEAAAADPYVALDKAVDKLEERLRRAADRRAARHSPHAVRSAPVAPGGRPASASNGQFPAPEVAAANGAAPSSAAPPAFAAGSAAAENDSPTRAADDGLLTAEDLIVREKTHTAPSMTLPDALHHMELVGHDFYLFADTKTGLPSVVYRRRGYAYGVIRLETNEDAGPDAVEDPLSIAVTGGDRTGER